MKYHEAYKVLMDIKYKVLRPSFDQLQMIDEGIRKSTNITDTHKKTLLGMLPCVFLRPKDVG